MESFLGGCTAHSTFFEEFGTQVLGEVIIHIIIPIFHPLLCFILGFYCVRFMRSVIHMGGGGGQIFRYCIGEKIIIVFILALGWDRFLASFGYAFQLCIPDECWDAALVHF